MPAPADAKEMRAPRCAVAPAELLRLIHSVVAGRPFTSRELLRHAAVEPSGLLRAVLTGMQRTSPKRLGKLLRNLEQNSHTSFLVKRVATERRSLIWRVQKR